MSDDFTYNTNTMPPMRPHQCCAIPDGARCVRDASWHILAVDEQPEMFVEACTEHVGLLLEDKEYTLTPIRAVAPSVPQ